NGATPHPGRRRERPNSHDKTAETVERIKREALGAASQPDGVPRSTPAQKELPGYQGTEAERNQIEDALEATSAEHMMVSTVAGILRPFYGKDKAGIGGEHFQSWLKKCQPDVEPPPADYGLKGLASPAVDLHDEWAKALSQPYDDPG